MWGWWGSDAAVSTSQYLHHNHQNIDIHIDAHLRTRFVTQQRQTCGIRMNFYIWPRFLCIFLSPRHKHIRTLLSKINMAAQTQEQLSDGALDAAPLVFYLGPISSYTHQVYTLADFERPPWSIGLTDYDLAQAALACFEYDRYDYRPAITITGSKRPKLSSPSTMLTPAVI